MATVGSVVQKFLTEYGNQTPKKLKIVDAYLVYILLTGVVQFAYCCLVGTFPFNSFLSGFISSVGSFVLAVCLRIQVNPENKSLFSGISQERAFADFIFAHLLLHLVVMNFLGWEGPESVENAGRKSRPSVDIMYSVILFTSFNICYNYLLVSVHVPDDDSFQIIRINLLNLHLQI